MCSARRVLSFVLVFVALAACVIPALTPPARAVAVVDDAIVIGVGLMFAGLTGITFSRSDHAVSAIQKFLTDCADVAQQIAALAAESVQDGIFKFTATNKLVYATIVAAMQGYFTSAADETGALTGTLDMNGFYPTLQRCWWDKADVSLLADISVGADSDHKITSTFVTPLGNVLIESYHTFARTYFAWTNPDGTKGTTSDDNVCNFRFGFFLVSTGDLAWWIYRVKSADNCALVRGVTIAKSYVPPDNITYLQDAAVDGTSALDQFEQIPEPDKDPDDDDKPVEVPFVPLPIPNELETARRGLNQDADGNPLTDAQGNPLTDADGNPLTQAKPGIVPSERIGTLTDAISQAKTDTPTPDNPNDNPDDERTKRHDADWQNLFPFCIPFDLIEFLGVLAADPVAPKFEWRIYAPNVVDYTLEIDLSPFDSVAKICRTMELLAFCIGLILITRNIIRG